MAQIFLMPPEGGDVIFHELWTCWQFKKEIAHMWIYMKFKFLIRRGKIKRFQNIPVVVQLCL